MAAGASANALKNSLLYRDVSLEAARHRETSERHRRVLTRGICSLEVHQEIDVELEETLCGGEEREPELLTERFDAQGLGDLDGPLAGPARGLQIAAAPLGIELDSQAEVLKYADRLYEMTVMSKTMPPDNATHMTEEERQTIAGWYAMVQHYRGIQQEVKESGEANE